MFSSYVKLPEGTSNPNKPSVQKCCFSDGISISWVLGAPENLCVECFAFDEMAELIAYWDFIQTAGRRVIPLIGHFEGDNP